MQKKDQNAVKNNNDSLIMVIEECLRASRAGKGNVDRLIKILDGVELEHYLGNASDEEHYAEDENFESDRFLYDKNRFRDLYLPPYGRYVPARGPRHGGQGRADEGDRLPESGGFGPRTDRRRARD